MKRFLIAGLFFILLCGIAPAQSVAVTSGTVTLTAQSQSGFTVITLDWLSDASGNCIATVSGMQGTVIRMTVNPDATPTTPTASYDATLADRDAIDIMRGQGANLSATASTSVACLIRDANTTTDIPIVTLGDLTLTIAAAGNARGGIFRFYLKP